MVSKRAAFSNRSLRAAASALGVREACVVQARETSNWCFLNIMDLLVYRAFVRINNEKTSTKTRETEPSSYATFEQEKHALLHKYTSTETPTRTNVARRSSVPLKALRNLLCFVGIGAVKLSNSRFAKCCAGCLY